MGAASGALVQAAGRVRAMVLAGEGAQAAQIFIEESTPAFRMSDTPTRRTAERRRAKLMELQQQISLERNRERIGKSFDAIVTGVCQETEHLLEGRFVSQAPEIDGRLLINDGLEFVREFPQIVRVEGNDAHPYDLVGGIVG